jgi:hypothetical protein
MGILHWWISAGAKWLKDRKGRVLSYEDIQHYQKIIVALAETDRLMKEIDKIEI